MTAGQDSVLAWLGEQKPAMMALLEEVVNIDSGSYDKPGVDQVGERFLAFFAEHGIRAKRLVNEGFGDAVLADVSGVGGGNKPVLLLGHRDTVFPKGEASRRPFSVEGARAYGPGVCDMKAGLVMNAFLLAAFHRFGGAPGPLVGLFTSDEEIGSPACRSLIEETARGARAVLNSEPGRPSGNVVTGRKGGVFMRLAVEGRAAHSGGNFAEGISAITELAHKIVALQGVTDLERGITLNVGLVSGGQSVNTVAPSAEAGIDLRYVHPPERAEAMVRIEEIVATATVPGTSAALEISGEFLPLVQDAASRDLFDAYAGAMRELGAAVEGEFAGGCADSGFTATLCAVGPIGGKAHSPEEWCDLDSLVPRAQAAALTIARLGA